MPQKPNTKPNGSSHGSRAISGQSTGDTVPTVHSYPASAFCIFSPGTSTVSSTTYMLTGPPAITPTLKSINDRLQVDLREQSSETTRLRQELAALKSELEQLRSLSAKQEDLLTNANKLLEQYATEEKKAPPDKGAKKRIFYRNGCGCCCRRLP